MVWASWTRRDWEEGEVEELIAGGGELEVEVASPDLPKLREAIDAISGADWSGAGADRRPCLCRQCRQWQQSCLFRQFRLP